VGATLIQNFDEILLIFFSKTSHQNFPILNFLRGGELNQNKIHGHFGYNKQFLEKYWCWDNFQVASTHALQFISPTISRFKGKED
jgi:hypothetical protein